MSTEDISRKMVAAAIRYDEHQSKKPGYNIHALPQYLRRIQEVCSDIDQVTPIREAILSGFSSALCNAMLRAVGEPKATKGETDNRALFYPRGS